MLSNNDANSMQKLLTKLIAKKINAATSHIRRIIMSEDVDENPAELFGENGKIFYRAGGNPKAEIGTATGGFWVPDGTDTILSASVTGINTNGQELKATGVNDLIFEVPAGRSFIFRTI